MDYTLSPDEITPEFVMRENLPDMPPFQAACTRAALGIKTVFKRGEKYLNESYQWSDVPNGFDEWQADALQAIIHKMPDPPTHWGWCDGDLDKVKWEKM